MNTLKKYRSQFSDRHNYVFGSATYINEIHLILDFEGKIDQNRMKKALRLLLDAEPLLGCRFVKHWLKPCWYRLPEHELDSAALLEVAETDESVKEVESNAFFRTFIELEQGPQIKALLISGGKEERLILKIQHLMCDAGGFKTLLNLLFKIYGNLVENPEYTPVQNNGSRSLRQVYSRFAFLDLLRIFWRGIIEYLILSYPFKCLKYPANRNNTGNLSYIFKRFPAARVSKINNYARQKGVTINDLFSSALLRAMVRQFNLSKGWLRLIGTVDLRRYLPERKAEGLCMVTGAYALNIKAEQCNKDSDTLKIVKKQTDIYKMNFIGLGFFLIYWLSTRPYPFFLLERIVPLFIRIGQWIGYASIGFTNLGLIDADTGSFNSIRLLSAEMTCPGSIPPMFLCALSGFNGTLT
ncbi:MAG: hypothetical protein GY795_39435, partial [Desulfobacterales bacterium]|nr:hypothetical protein [Desulfobacterales bacterium]